MAGFFSVVMAQESPGKKMKLDTMPAYSDTKDIYYLCEATRTQRQTRPQDLGGCLVASPTATFHKSLPI